jgi:hypothetical protein
MALAAGTRGLHPADIAADVDLGAREADVERKIDDRGRDHDVLDPVTQGGNHRHRQHEQRKGHHHIDEAADAAIELAPGIAAERADDGADHEGDADRGNRNGKIEARSDDEAAEHIASELVGAGEMRRARRQKRLRDIGDHGIIGHDPRPEDRNQDEQRNAGRGNGRERIAAQNPDRMAKSCAGHSIDTLGSAMP